MKTILSVLVLAGTASVAMADDHVGVSGSPQTVNGYTINGEYHTNGGVGARNVIAYDNRAGGLFTSGIRPAFVMDDVSFTPGPAAGGGQFLTGINFGFSVNGPASFDAQIYFFDTLTGAASPVNTGLFGAFSVGFGSVANGSYQSGLIDITSLSIFAPDDNLGVVFRFVQAGTNTLATNVTSLFAGGGATVGSSQDVYWRDADGNGQFDSGDARFFNGAPNLANVYMQLEVPAPASLALLGLGGIVAGRRRR
ncbi:MAG: PEP-CTERM sorting domain-containing protein [Planctomycetota bacterium]